SPPSTVGPDQPGLGWAATPGGLSTTAMSSSSCSTTSPSTGTGTTVGPSLGVPGGGGRSTSSQLPARRRSDLPAGAPSSVTAPVADSSAALVRDRPNSRASP